MPLKLGILVPSSNTALEPLTSAIVAQLSPAVSVHYSRFQVTEISLKPAALAQFNSADASSPIIAAALLLATAKVDVIGWSGTSGGWLGFDQDEALCKAITEATGGIPATTSTLALNRALDLLAASKGITGPKPFGLVTPYLDDVQDKILATYAAAGYDVAAESHLRKTVNVEFADIDEATLGAQVKDVVARGREKGVLLGVTTFCTNLSAAQYAEKWEKELDIVLLDTVSTVLWDMLRIKGWEKGAIKGWGKLFEL
ncbi:maleate cis-trans isomerase [Thozetella sp. PMI_491]|nr:maleate cis-trans isomerase [Thozetella sp. PMI_491]